MAGLGEAHGTAQRALQDELRGSALCRKLRLFSRASWSGRWSVRTGVRPGRDQLVPHYSDARLMPLNTPGGMWILEPQIEENDTSLRSQVYLSYLQPGPLPSSRATTVPSFIGLSDAGRQVHLAHISLATA